MSYTFYDLEEEVFGQIKEVDSVLEYIADKCRQLHDMRPQSKMQDFLLLCIRNLAVADDSEFLTYIQEMLYREDFDDIMIKVKKGGVEMIVRPFDDDDSEDNIK